MPRSIPIETVHAVFDALERGVDRNKIMLDNDVSRSAINNWITGATQREVLEERAAKRNLSPRKYREFLAAQRPHKMGRPLGRFRPPDRSKLTPKQLRTPPSGDMLETYERDEALRIANARANAWRL